jgi:hypothetical protein
MAGDSSARKVSVETEDDLDEMLGHEDAARLIGRTPNTLYGYCHEGRIRRTRDGRKSLYRRGDLMELAASLRQEIPASDLTKSD